MFNKNYKNKLSKRKGIFWILWRSSSQVQSQGDLITKKIEQCDVSDYKVIRLFNSFEEIVEDANKKNIKLNSNILK